MKWKHNVVGMNGHMQCKRTSFLALQVQVWTSFVVTIARLIHVMWSCVASNIRILQCCHVYLPRVPISISSFSACLFFRSVALGFMDNRNHFNQSSSSFSSFAQSSKRLINIGSWNYFFTSLLHLAGLKGLTEKGFEEEL